MGTHFFAFVMYLLCINSITTYPCFIPVLRCPWKGQNHPGECDEVLQAKLPRQEPLGVADHYRAVGDREAHASAEPRGFPPDYAGRERDGRPGGYSRNSFYTSASAR